MSSEDRNGSMLNQFVNTLIGSDNGSGGHNTPPDMTRFCAFAGAAFLGGAAYYYLNNFSNRAAKLIDFKNQSREIEVKSRQVFREGC
jgi:hypothetical protein